MFVIYFDEADFEYTLAGGLDSVPFLEEISDDPLEDAGFLVTGSGRCAHGVGFTAAGLPVGQNGGIVALKDHFDHVLDGPRVDQVLRILTVEGLVESELAVLVEHHRGAD